MTYELAKKLKDAGFPQKVKCGDRVFWGERYYLHLGGGHNGNEGLYAEEVFTCCLDEYNKVDSDLDINNSVRNIMDAEVLLIPTLSELIGACGKIGVKIGYQNDGRIYAEFDKDDGHGNLLDFCMSSLEEIYANLWLELNKKLSTV